MSSVVRNGSEEATKSTRRPGSSIFAAMVRSSSDSVGDSETICWNWPITTRTSASTEEVLSDSAGSKVSTSATMNGSVCT